MNLALAYDAACARSVCIFQRSMGNFSIYYYFYGTYARWGIATVSDRIQP